MSAQSRSRLAPLLKTEDYWAIGPIKRLRSWCFLLCFLRIGLSTRFRELATFGMKPFWAFTIGVVINVPLGYVLSSYIFAGYWSAI